MTEAAYAELLKDDFEALVPPRPNLPDGVLIPVVPDACGTVEKGLRDDLVTLADKIGKYLAIDKYYKERLETCILNT